MTVVALIVKCVKKMVSWSMHHKEPTATTLPWQINFHHGFINSINAPQHTTEWLWRNVSVAWHSLTRRWNALLTCNDNTEHALICEWHLLLIHWRDASQFTLERQTVRVPQNSSAYWLLQDGAITKLKTQERLWLRGNVCVLYNNQIIIIGNTRAFHFLSFFFLCLLSTLL